MSIARAEPKVKVFIPLYEPLETIKCKKCGKVIAEPKELIRIQEALSDYDVNFRNRMG